MNRSTDSSRDEKLATPTAPKAAPKINAPRFDLKVVRRHVNGALSVELFDRKKQVPVEIMLYESYDGYILTGIDPANLSATLVDTDMKDVVLKTKTELLDATNGK
ncbi:MAG: hypothetical protein J0M26_19015 [Planctomycetes bacterium]|nr:hypothetical protein [Planctomycetota bacterium]